MAKSSEYAHSLMERLDSAYGDMVRGMVGAYETYKALERDLEYLEARERHGYGRGLWEDGV